MFMSYQNLETSIKELRTSIGTLTLTRQGTNADLTELVRARTELECIVADLRVASERAGGKHEELEAELAIIQQQISEKEAALTELRPEWEQHRARENEEKRRMEEARARLDALYSKQGRLNRFRTKAERDRFLRQELAGLETYRTTQTQALDAARNALEQTRGAVTDVEERLEAIQGRAEDGRNRAKELGENIVRLRDEHAEMSERRKELWREETKLKSLVDNEADELRQAERTLASMMDKVSEQMHRIVFLA